MSSVVLGGALVVAGSVVGPPANAATVPITATIRDFDHETKVNAPNAHPDFESKSGDDTEIVTDRLGADGKPVYKNPDAGSATTTSKLRFDQWYRDDASVNRSFSHTLNFDVTNGVTTFDGADFFPADNKGWNDPTFGNAGQVDEGHNFSFTMETHLTFTYDADANPAQSFTFDGDDDVFVYFNRYLGINLGGVHPAATQTVVLNEIAAANEANLVDGQTYPLDIFFAERHTTESNFNIDANFAVAQATGGGASSSTSSTTTSTTTSTTLATTTSTVRATTTTARVASTIVRTGSPTSPLVAFGFGFLALGALLGLVDRNRYRGQHFLRN